MDRQIVRCKQGALYATVWVRFVSFKGIRLGGTRLQRCPVHHRWEPVSRVDETTLTPEQLREAKQTRDIGIP